MGEPTKLSSGLRSCFPKSADFDLETKMVSTHVHPNIEFEFKAAVDATLDIYGSTKADIWPTCAWRNAYWHDERYSLGKGSMGPRIDEPGFDLMPFGVTGC